MVAPEGPLADEDIQEFSEAVAAQLEADNPHLVIDMGEVPYVDSQGLEVLLGFARELRDRSLPLKLALLTSTCREILDLTELTEEFEIFDEVDDAVRSFL